MDHRQECVGTSAKVDTGAPQFEIANSQPLALLPDVGVHYYTTDVPQTSAKVSEEAPGVSEKEAAEHPREVTP